MQPPPMAIAIVVGNAERLGQRIVHVVPVHVRSVAIVAGANFHQESRAPLPGVAERSRVRAVIASSARCMGSGRESGVLSHVQLHHSYV